MSELNIDAGVLNKRIEIVQRVKAFNAAGYETTDAKLIRRCWAQFTRQSGTEGIRAGADLSAVKVRFLIRACQAELSRLMDVKYNGDYYGITYINEYGDNGQYTEILGELKELGGQNNGTG